MSATLTRLLKRALWCEALHETYPNRFTLWLWKRAVERLRQERDHPKPKRAKINWEFMDPMGSILVGVAGAKTAAKAQAKAHAEQVAYQQQLYNQYNQSAGPATLSLLLGGR